MAKPKGLKAVAKMNDKEKEEELKKYKAKLGGDNTAIDNRIYYHRRQTNKSTVKTSTPSTTTPKGKSKIAKTKKNSIKKTSPNMNKVLVPCKDMKVAELKKELKVLQNKKWNDLKKDVLCARLRYHRKKSSKK